MNLKVKNRVTLLSILPAKGDIVTMTIKHDIANKVSLTQDDISKLDVKATDSGITWDNAKDSGIDVEFSELELKLIKEKIAELDKAGEITDNVLELNKLVSV